MLSVSEFCVYPVKSCGRWSLLEAVIAEGGFEHDREWMIVEEDGYFIVINGSEESIKRAQEIVKMKHYNHKEKVLKKLKEEDEKAAEGLGNILGM